MDPIVVYIFRYMLAFIYPESIHDNKKNFHCLKIRSESNNVKRIFTKFQNKEFSFSYEVIDHE